MANGEKIGEVIHYFGKIDVAVLKLSEDLKIGENIHFLGRHTDFLRKSPRCRLNTSR